MAINFGQTFLANIIDPNQTAPKEQSDQGLHCLPLFVKHILIVEIILSQLLVSTSVMFNKTMTNQAVYRGWSGGAMVLCKLPVPGHHTNLDYTVSGHKYFIKVRIPIDFNAFFGVQEN